MKRGEPKATKTTVQRRFKEIKANPFSFLLLIPKGVSWKTLGPGLEAILWQHVNLHISLSKMVRTTKMGADSYLTSTPRLRGELQVPSKATGLRMQFQTRIGHCPRPATQLTQRPSFVGFVLKKKNLSHFLSPLMALATADKTLAASPKKGF